MELVLILQILIGFKAMLEKHHNWNIISGSAPIVKVLLDRGLDEQHRDNAGWGPLHYAAFEGICLVISVLEAKLLYNSKCPSVYKKRNE